MGERMTRRLDNPEKPFTIINKYRTTLEKNNKSKITRVCRKMQLSRKERIPLTSYCCQGCKNGPHSPPSLSSNCEKVYWGILVIPHLQRHFKCKSLSSHFKLCRISKNVFCTCVIYSVTSRSKTKQYNS